MTTLLSLAATLVIAAVLLATLIGLNGIEVVVGDALRGVVGRWAGLWRGKRLRAAQGVREGTRV